MSEHPYDGCSEHSPSRTAHDDEADFGNIDVELRRLQESDVPDLIPLWNEAFRAKRFLGCCATHPSLKSMRRNFSKRYPDDKLKLTCLAIQDEKIVGMIQLTKKGLPMYSGQPCERDEMRIELLAVDEAYRRQGIGSTLLRWAESKARSTKKIKRLTLEVVRGNHAVALFKKFGFEVANALDEDCFAYFGAAGWTCCKYGRPYGFCNPEWGYFRMEKDLPRTKDRRR